ncbi:MAG: VanZ family protein [Jiangellaceae bacterium]
MTARLLFGVAVLAQLVVLYAPDAPAGPVAVPHLDTVVHVAVFAAVVWSGRRAGLPVWPLVVISVVQAVGSEAVQAALLPGRSGDPGDVVADLAGIALGVLLSRTRLGHDTAREGTRPGSIDPDGSSQDGRRADR